MRRAVVWGTVAALAGAIGMTGACGPAFDDGQSGGAGGSGSGANGGVGGSEPCQPGASIACYTGPDGTQDVGICKAGLRVCNADGTGYGECQAEVVPKEEDCEAPGDEDCDGTPNDDCPCEPGSEAECYSGPRGTAGVGICQVGSQVCKQTGDGFGPCTGEVLPFAAEDCSGTEDKDCSGYACAEAIWSKIFGDVSGQGASAAGVDATGNVYVLGRFAGTIDLGGGPLISAGESDVFVAKFDPLGGHVWSKRFGNASNQVFNDLAVAPNGESVISVVSFGSGGHSIVKLDAAGNTIFSKPIGDATDGSEAKVAIDSSGNVAIATQFTGCFDTSCNLQSAGGADGYIARYAANGQLSWAVAIDGPDDDSATGVAFDAAGNLLVSGGFTGTINLGSTAATALTSVGASDMLVAKFDAAGGHAWSRRFGGATFAGIYASGGSPIAVDAAGGVVVAGYFNGAFEFDGQPIASQGGPGDGVLFSLTSGGVPAWAVGFGGTGRDGADGLAIDTNGDIVMSGISDGPLVLGGEVLPAFGGNDLLLVKWSATGSHLWSRRFGNGEAQYAGGVATGPANEIILVGNSPGSIDLGLGPLVAAGDSDALIAKFAP